MQKSYNQRWKESGTSLSYKEWRKREDEKMSSFDGMVIPQVKAPNLKDDLMFKKTQEEMIKLSDYKENTSGKTTLGINQKVLIVGALIVLGAVGYKIYKKYKK